MSFQHKAGALFGIGVALLTVGLSAAARPASAEAPLISHAAQIQPLFPDWNRDQDTRGDHDQDRWRGEQSRRDAERARHEAEERHQEWLRHHRYYHYDNDRHDNDRHDSNRRDNDQHDNWQRHNNNNNQRDWQNNHH